jgi:hypothetical protein
MPVYQFLPQRCEDTGEENLEHDRRRGVEGIVIRAGGMSQSRKCCRPKFQHSMRIKAIKMTFSFCQKDVAGEFRNFMLTLF